MARVKLRCIMGCPGLKSSYWEKGPLSEMILKRKDYYRLLSDKLNDLHASAESCWSILETFCNGKKIPLTLS